MRAKSTDPGARRAAFIEVLSQTLVDIVAEGSEEHDVPPAVADSDDEAVEGRA